MVIQISGLQHIGFEKSKPAIIISAVGDRIDIIAAVTGLEVIKSVSNIVLMHISIFNKIKAVEQVVLYRTH